ncbi:unnamed protein product [Adineta steineri]|uniref:Lipid droplet-associated hydrolase n=1 Tax=Adineta steineri TaxID=433720 RepID=A0A819FHV1_9BILA|nr:unnamed protein product [Adineta steineri]
METKQEILNINGISTHTYQLGNQSLSSKTIVIIPGNPGLGGFYIPFAHELYNLFNENISILVISQAGHSPPLKHCFTLNEQIEHKLQAIKQLVPNNSNHQLILIGHSIGAYMVLNMLDKLENKLNRAFLLFPTIERMGESDAGQRFVRLYPILIYLLPFLCFITNILLPFDWLKRKIISYYFSQSPLNDREILIDTVLYDLLNPLAIKNLLQMANEEIPSGTGNNSYIHPESDEYGRRHFSISSNQNQHETTEDDIENQNDKPNILLSSSKAKWFDAVRTVKQLKENKVRYY